MAGDAPLLRGETIQSLVESHGDAMATVLTAEVDDPAHMDGWCDQMVLLVHCGST